MRAPGSPSMRWTRGVDYLPKNFEDISRNPTRSSNCCARSAYAGAQQPPVWQLRQPCAGRNAGTCQQPCADGGVGSPAAARSALPAPGPGSRRRLRHLQAQTGGHRYLHRRLVALQRVLTQLAGQLPGTDRADPACRLRSPRRLPNAWTNCASASRKPRTVTCCDQAWPCWPRVASR